MAEFFSLLKMMVLCGTGFFVTTMILLRSVGLEMTKWAAAVLLFFLVASPVDVIPDVLPGIGWIDDLGYIGGGIGMLRAAVAERRQRVFVQACENAEMARRAGLDLPAGETGAQAAVLAEEGVGHGR